MDNSLNEPRHVPVLQAEAIAALAPRPGGVYVDTTFGGGGYSRALLARPVARVAAVDRDPAAVARARALAATDPRLLPLHGRFGDLERLLAEAGIARVDGIVADLGLSSDQLEDPTRGFAFQADGPLDMRMDGTGPTAADLLARLDEGALAELLARLGDEPDARRIARAIVRRRARAPSARSTTRPTSATAIWSAWRSAATCSPSSRPAACGTSSPAWPKGRGRPLRHHRPHSAERSGWGSPPHRHAPRNAWSPPDRKR